jgi:hypothetical protein
MPSRHIALLLALIGFAPATERRCARAMLQTSPSVFPRADAGSHKLLPAFLSSAPCLSGQKQAAKSAPLSARRWVAPKTQRPAQVRWIGLEAGGSGGSREEDEEENGNAEWATVWDGGHAGFLGKLVEECVALVRISWRKMDVRARPKQQPF